MEIGLWKGRQNLGIMTLQRALTDVLRPGTTLSWRVGDEALRQLGLEGRSTDASGAEVETSTCASDKGVNNCILHYDIIKIEESSDRLDVSSAIIRDVREKGMYRLFSRSNGELPGGPGPYSLPMAYKILEDPDMAARYPVQFHITSPKNRMGPHGVEWALHNRADLRPEVPNLAGDATWEDRTDDFFKITARKHRPRVPPAPKDKAQPDPPGPGKVNRTQAAQAATGTQARLSRESQIKFEDALGKALRKTTAHIHRNHQKLLKTTVRRRLKKLNGGPTTPLPAEVSQMKEKEEAAIEQVLLKVRANFERRHGIKIEPTGVPEDDSLEGSRGGTSSRKRIPNRPLKQ
ncbi:hypothetical protein KVR01_007291 [Diaporthe batatas]|uniref:uncharacterized protein n=1 Tax=Diaporthe batatas TaxID=748121 RepID=UPI001D03BE49|nr:uncharacterized protein KVR01_007291 [Diaporthe batatas]KAG8162813.1 hypothetical protein KVR01_007291 [Diaporthe batatas]